MNRAFTSENVQFMITFISGVFFILDMLLWKTTNIDNIEKSYLSFIKAIKTKQNSIFIAVSTPFPTADIRSYYSDNARNSFKLIKWFCLLETDGMRWLWNVA